MCQIFGNFLSKLYGSWLDKEAPQAFFLLGEVCKIQRQKGGGGQGEFGHPRKFKNLNFFQKSFLPVLVNNLKVD